MHRSVLLVLLITLGFGGAAQAAPRLHSPTLSAAEVAFAHAGDLWVVSRSGGDARRLTTGVGMELDPVFSPDGRWIAFTGEYEGNFDIHLVEASGGVPRRLTWHPHAERVLGWTPDGKRVLFRSGRNSPFASQLFTMPVEGGLPSELPFPMGQQGSFSPDASRLAYVPYWNRTGSPVAHVSWRRYRGGRTSPIWIARMSDSAVEEIPRDNSNDWNPIWIGDRVYFLSDRNGAATLFSYHPEARKVTEVVKAGGADIASAAAGPGAIVYEQAGRLYLLELSSGQAKALDVRVQGDVASVRPRWSDIKDSIEDAALSPTGVRAAFEARGEILTVPAEKGDSRNLTRTPGVAERSPAWSPDGQKIAYLSDESGEYALHIADQTGTGPVQKINLGDPPSFFYTPKWSPDGKKILYTDKRLNVWYVDVAKGKPVRVDTEALEWPVRLLDPVWSPDSRWIAYTRTLRNNMRAVFLYSLETGKARQVTDGLSDARYAAFDRDGKHLYFTASTDAGPTTGWLDLSSWQRPVSRSVYVAVLDKTLPSPLAPKSDEEKDAAKKEEKADGDEGKDDKDKKDEPKPARVDFEGLDQRVLALPIPARNYTGLVAGKSGELFLLEDAPVLGFGGQGSIVHKFTLESRKTEKLYEGQGAHFRVSHDGEKMLLHKGPTWTIASTAKAPEPGAGALALDGVKIYVDPRAEWRQMFHEVWRIQRDFFYDPNLHGLDLQAAIRRHEPSLDGIAHRADLSYLFNEMLGDLTVGHLFIAGGDRPEVEGVAAGLLGADYAVENGRYRFARVYGGENWNPELQAPLTQPGVNVKPGEYLLAVGGRELRGSDNVYNFFEATAGKSVVIKVGPNPDGKGSREVSVVPVENEGGLRLLAWVEGNRRKVDELSGGRLAYVYLPDTAEGGYTNFNRYFFAQVDREGAILDERFNGGGFAADYFIDYLRRPLLNYWTTREGADFTTPFGAIYGPKVMLVNQYSSSGGDALPWYFRKLQIGPLVGKRTWGGLVGIYDYPPLMDGATVTAPRVAFWSPDGSWDVENHGVAPDIEVELDPQAWRQGSDLQLEKAVKTALEALEKNPLPKHRKPAYPDYNKGGH